MSCPARLAIVLVLALGVAASGRPAQADGGVARRLRIHLSLEAPAADGCVGRRDLERAVESRLGRSVFGDRTDADLLLFVDLHKVDLADLWAATVDMRDHHQELGTRTVTGTGPGCRAVDEPLALVIALVVDSFGVDMLAPRATPAERGCSYVGAGGRGAVHALPGAAIGAAAVGSLALVERLVLHAEIGGWLPREAVTAGVGARFAAYDASIELCARLAGGARGRALGCAGGRVGLWEAEGVGQDSTGHGWHPVGDALAGFRVEGARGALAWAAGAGAGYALVRNRFVYRDSDGGLVDVYQRPRLAGRVEVSLGWIFR